MEIKALLQSCGKVESGNPIVDALEVAIGVGDKIKGETYGFLADLIAGAIKDEVNGWTLIQSAFEKYRDSDKLTKKARHGTLRMTLRRVTMDEDTGTYLTCKSEGKGPYVILKTQRKAQPEHDEVINKAITKLVELCAGMDEESTEEVADKVRVRLLARFADQVQQDDAEVQPAQAAVA